MTSAPAVPDRFNSKKQVQGICSYAIASHFCDLYIDAVYDH